MTAITTFDDENDVLYIKEEGSKIRESQQHDNMILNYDAQNKIVGIQILWASDFIDGYISDGPYEANFDYIPAWIEECINSWSKDMATND